MFGGTIAFTSVGAPDVVGVLEVRGINFRRVANLARPQRDVPATPGLQARHEVDEPLARAVVVRRKQRPVRLADRSLIAVNPRIIIIYY